MPKNKRDYLKRNLAYAMYYTMLAMQQVGIVYTVFEPVHPELAEVLKQAGDGYEIIGNLINSFSREAWGKDETNWEGYMGLSEAQLEQHEPIIPNLSHLYRQTVSKTSRRNPKK